MQGGTGEKREHRPPRVPAAINGVALGGIWAHMTDLRQVSLQSAGTAQQPFATLPF